MIAKLVKWVREAENKSLSSTLKINVSDQLLPTFPNGRPNARSTVLLVIGDTKM